jgi:hypothetical protein
MNELPARIWLFLVLASILSGCSGYDASWPPAPRDEQERVMIEAALHAVVQIDGWSQTACVVKQHKGEWQVEAWRIVHPEAEGRNRCVPWAVRGITLDAEARVLSYRNHL